MSKHSLKYNVNQRKFSLKFIFYIFVLLDLMLYFSISPDIFGQLLIWELFTFLGLLIGMRGQVRYKELVYDLIAIRQDPQYNDNEDLRGFRLARHIDHACIEWDLWYQEQQHKNKNKKEVKNNMSKLIIDEVVWKQIGYALVGLWGLFGLVLAYILDMFLFHWVLIIFITGAWEILDVLVLFYIHYIFLADIITEKEIAELIKD